MSRRASVRVLLAGVLGVCAALLVACGSSTGKLIPLADAGPLQSDFETVAQAAEAGNGNCSATETALARTEQDFNALPASVDSGLRATLRQGIENLRSHALALCAEPLVQTTTSTTPKTTTSTAATPPATTPTTTPTNTTPATTTPTETSSTPTPGGGTPAPGVGEATPGAGGGTGAAEGPAGGVGAEPGGGAGGNGQEAGK
jgi:hypothetical protein